MLAFPTTKIRIFIVSFIMFFSVPVVSVAQEIMFKSGGIITRGASGVEQISIYSKSPLFVDDHSKAVEFIGEKFDLFSISNLGDKGILAEKIDTNLRLKEGSKRTYESDMFSSIIFAEVPFPRHKATEIDKLYLIQAIYRGKGRPYYFYAILGARDNIAKMNTPKWPVRRIEIWSIFLFNEAGTDIPFDFFQDYAQRYIANDFEWGRRKVDRIGILTHPDDDVASVVYSGQRSFDFVSEVQKFNNRLASSEGFLFSGSTNELFNKIEPNIRGAVLKPICDNLLQLSGNQLDNGVVSVSLQPFACVIESLGIMKVSLTGISDVNCETGKCSFNARVHCNTQALTLQPSCRNINSGLRSMFGETNGVPVTVEFRPNGRVKSISSGMR